MESKTDEGTRRQVSVPRLALNVLLVGFICQFFITMSIPLMFLATLIEERSAKDRAMRILSGRLVTAQEEERKHIARELHDEIGQILTVVKINLESLHEPALQASATASVAACVRNVDRAIQQARTLAHDLRPAILDDLGLPAALRWFVDQIPEGRPTAHLSLDGSEDETISPEVGTTAFRIAQEAVTNVLRHASARNVWVSLAARPSNLELSVRDDGLGFDLVQRRRTPATSFGLSSMEERVRLVGGQFEIRTAPGTGTEVRARFPTAGA
jgi:two-component system sensor histidine kinase UhpB